MLAIETSVFMVECPEYTDLFALGAGPLIVKCAADAA